MISYPEWQQPSEVAEREAVVKRDSGGLDERQGSGGDEK